MADGISYLDHNEMVFRVIAILEDASRTPERRIEDALTYCHGSGIYWPLEALNAFKAHIEEGGMLDDAP